MDTMVVIVTVLFALPAFAVGIWMEERAYWATAKKGAER